MEKNQPLFSVVVPVYNVEDYLAECLDSLLSQTLSDYEVIVVDDKSTDSSREIANRYADTHPGKIRVLAHPVNKGLGGARNTGIDVARGTYILFLDSDDYLKQETLEKLYVVLCQETADVVGFDFEHVDECGKFLRYERCSRSNSELVSQGRFALCHTVSACNKVFRRELFTDNGIRFPEKRYYEDYWTTPKLLMAAKKFVSCDEALYCYRQRGTSIMHDTNIAKAEDIMRGTDELVRFCRQMQFADDQLREVEMLAIEHVLLHATLRVNGIDSKSDMQSQLRTYMEETFADYKRNPFMHLLSGKYRRLMKLIERGNYRWLYLCYHRRNKLTGNIKRFLRKTLGEGFVRHLS